MLNQIKIKHLVLGICIFFVKTSFSLSLEGDWKLHDLRFPHQTMIVHIEKKHHEYRGIVIRARGVCQYCHGHDRQQAIKGMKILWGFKKHFKNLFDEGYFLDTHSGRIYRAQIKLHQKELYLRSYVGLPLLGQTYIWQRYHP